ncbi:hypothetical protein N431DRAFT_424419 [Stipitochalara longipes BDJ]|nr:hypothetical protein N431DRAFT_424419 [Stipitochalara longipes BDJ]
MPVPFGFSVGDCIAVCLLIRDAVKALDDSRGASAEYQEVIRELWAFDRALLEIELLSRTYESTIELNALSCTARQTAEKCRVCIEGFLDTCKGYNKALRQGGSGSVLRGIKGKVSWSILRKDNLSKFRTQINAHASVLNMLLLTANLLVSRHLNDKKLNERLNTSDYQLNQKLDNNTRRLEVQGSALTRLSNGILRTYFLTLGTELKSLMNKIWTISFGSYKILLNIQTRLPRDFGPCWVQEPVTFIDALGRVAPIHIELVNSWEVFEVSLEARFLNLPRANKIKSGEYAISDSASKRDLVRSQAFTSAFLPGRRINMSMLFQEYRSDNSCPVYRHESESPDYKVITW